MQTESGTPASTKASDAKLTDEESPWQWKMLTSSADFSCGAYLDWALTYPESSSTNASPIRLNTIFPNNESEGVALREIQRAPAFHLARVYIVSGIRGLLSGRIMEASSFLPSQSTQESCEVWTVILDKASGGLLSGESGSVVVDSRTNNVYGHVVGSDPLGHAYVVPIAHVLEQLMDSFGLEDVSCGLADPDWLVQALPRSSDPEVPGIQSDWVGDNTSALYRGAVLDSEEYIRQTFFRVRDDGVGLTYTANVRQPQASE
ncbi:hypothetical protein VTI74DRAFT_9007 [Chaetomium olivicolor]